MKIKWLGHACFIIECAGQVIVCDPFDDRLGYPPVRGQADIVTVSHDHYDHNAAGLLAGQPLIVKQAGEFQAGDIKICGIESFHDQQEGSQRGNNIIFKITAENLNLVHLGDLGHILKPQQIDQLGRVDILLIPVGGVYTVDAGGAREIVEQVKPSIVIPMHYKTPAISLPIAPVEAFISKYDQVVIKPFAEVSTAELTQETRVLVLDYL